MKGTHRLAVMLCLLSGLCSAGDGKQVLRIASEEWPPYSASNLEHYGLMNRIIAEAFATEGVTVEFGFFPGPRALELVKSGQWDATGGWTPTEERAKDHYFSDTLFQETMVFFHLKKRPFDWKTMADLKGVDIGTVYGSYYGEQFGQAAKSGTLAIQQEHSDALNFRKLLHGRIAVCPKNLDAGLSMLQLEFTPEERALITYHPRPVEQGPLVLMFSRKVETNRQMVEIFNKGLEQLKKSGKYDQYFTESRRGDYLIRPSAGTASRPR